MAPQSYPLLTLSSLRADLEVLRLYADRGNESTYMQAPAAKTRAEGSASGGVGGMGVVCESAEGSASGVRPQKAQRRHL